MKLFTSEKNKQLIARIRASRQNFAFDRQAQKQRLLLTLASPQPQPPSRNHRLTYGFAFKFAAGMAITILAASATFLIAQGANPGDALFEVNKLRERLVLALPLSAQKRAEVNVDIVQDRFEALDEIPVQSAGVAGQLVYKKLQTVRESRESFQRAVDVITRKQADLEQAGQIQAAEALVGVLANLNQMADRREATMMQLVQEAEDDTEREEIRANLELFQQARQKAETGLSRHKNRSD